MKSKHDWIKRLRGVEMTSAEFRVLIMMSTYTDANGDNAFPSVLRLAEDCCMERRAIQRHLRSLEQKRLIIKVSEGGNAVGFKRAAVYRLGGPEPIHKGGTGDALKGGADGTQGRSKWSSKGGNSTAPSVPSSNQYQRCSICKRNKADCQSAQSFGNQTHEYTPVVYDPTEQMGECVTCSRTYLGHQRAASKGGDRHSFEPKYGTDSFTAKFPREA